MMRTNIPRLITDVDAAIRTLRANSWHVHAQPERDWIHVFWWSAEELSLKISRAGDVEVVSPHGWHAIADLGTRQPEKAVS